MTMQNDCHASKNTKCSIVWSIISSQDNLSTNGKLYTVLDFDFFNVNSAKYFSIKFDQQYHHKGGSTGRVPPPPQ